MAAPSDLPPNVDLLSAVINVAATGNIVAAKGGKRIALYAFELLTQGVTTVRWSSVATSVAATSTALSAALALTTGQSWSRDLTAEPRKPHFVTDIGCHLTLTLGSSIQVDGVVWYYYL